MVWVFERTGRSTAFAALSPEEEELENLKSEMIQQSTIYAPGSPRIRMLASRIAALDTLVEEQRASRAVPDADGQAGGAGLRASISSWRRSTRGSSSSPRTRR